MMMKMMILTMLLSKANVNATCKNYKSLPEERLMVDPEYIVKAVNAACTVGLLMLEGCSTKADSNGNDKKAINDKEKK